jgi:hypothetical protein
MPEQIAPQLTRTGLDWTRKNIRRSPRPWQRFCHLGHHIPPAGPTIGKDGNLMVDCSAVGS